MNAFLHSPSRPCPLAEVPRWDFASEVVVVGFGAAGAAAAIEAAEAGAQVLLFEAASGSGGTSALAGGDIYLGGNGGTPAQRANGFEDQSEDMLRYMMMAGGPDADAARVRLYVDNALNHYGWLKSQGIPYRNTYLPGKRLAPATGDCLIWSGSEAAWPFSEQAKPAPRGHLPEIAAMGGRLLVDTLAARAAEKGVQVQYDAKALALIAGANNRVEGVVVRIDGEARFARARRGVVLATGGFVLSKEMLARFAPHAFRLGNDALSAGHDDGSGIRMGMSVGGAAIHMDQIFTTLPFYPPEDHVKGIFVNSQGQRFINEDAYPGRIAAHCLKQTGDRFWLLADNAIFSRPLEYARLEIAAVAESWEEIERELGLPADTLSHTVAVHNRHAAKGEDPLFHKAANWLKVLNEPPYVAIACHFGQAFFSYFTLGGLHVKPTGEVLNADGQVVPGLYACGRTVSGLPRWGEGYSSGFSLGDCTFFGRLAGRSAATA